MNDVDRLILEAWEKLGPKIMADPDELNKRLARRRSALLTRPPRAWCLAVRASDRRITPAHWIITPEHAMDLDHPDHNSLRPRSIHIEQTLPTSTSETWPFYRRRTSGQPI